MDVGDAPHLIWYVNPSGFHSANPRNSNSNSDITGILTADPVYPSGLDGSMDPFETAPVDLPSASEPFFLHWAREFQ